MKPNLPPSCDINELVSYGTRLYPNGRPLEPKWHNLEKSDDGIITLPWPIYPEVVKQFFHLASRDCWNDYGYEPNAAERLLKDREFINRASLSEIKTLLTYCVRGEKFCDGHWAMMMRDGHIQRILARLRECLPRFEYCALRYLNMWLDVESNWCAAMTGIDEKEKLGAMSKFAAAYRISRNLHRKHDADQDIPRFSPVLAIIDKLKPHEFQGDNLVSTVDNVNKQISAAYGRSGLLSVTTKFLWLRFKSPIIIYDKQARLALRIKPGDLAGFYSKWRQQFESYHSEIANVCSSLFEVRNYARQSQLITPEFIREVATQRWFHERVFDIYLWTIGGG